MAYGTYRKMFMWEWQATFRDGVEALAQRALGAVCVELRPTALILGVPVNDSKDAVCLEPEVCDFSPSDFSNIHAQAQALYSADPAHNRAFGSPYHMQRYKESLRPKAIGDAISRILESHGSSKSKRSFCSFPVKIGDFWVIAVLQVPLRQFDALPSLKRAYENNDDMKLYRWPRSLQESVMEQVLAEAHEELHRPSRGSNILFGNADRVLEDAGIMLARGVAHKARSFQWGLWSLANDIAMLRYEKSDAAGRIVVAPEDHADVMSTVRFAKPIGLGNQRAVRKLLETSGPNGALLVGKDGIWGIGSVAETYDGSDENLFEVNFRAHCAWELSHRGQVLMAVKYRQPSLPRAPIDESLVRETVRKLFGMVHSESVEKLISVAKAAIEQRHGTMLMITPAAEIEAQRLKGESFAVEPMELTPALVRSVSAIDGAVLVSPDMTMYAFGVILDGRVSPHGDPSRGARYNSAIRYVDGLLLDGRVALALIVSEDGYVDLYHPPVRPRIRRSVIDNAFSVLERVLASDSGVDSAPGREAMNTLEQNRFYLRATDVARANELREKVAARLEREQAAAVKGTLVVPIPVQIAEFFFNEEMSEDFYLPEEPGT